MIIALVIIIWLVCGAIEYAANLAYFQREFPLIAEECYLSDVRLSIFFGLFGPVGLLVEILFSGFKHGLKWK